MYNFTQVKKCFTKLIFLESRKTILYIKADIYSINFESIYSARMNYLKQVSLKSCLKNLFSSSINKMHKIVKNFRNTNPT